MTTVAICHPGNLLGKELRETLGRGEGGLAGSDVRLLSTRQEEIGTLTEVGGAVKVVQPYNEDSLEGVAIAFFCGPIEANRPLLAALPAGVRAIVLSPDAEPRDGHPVVAGVNGGEARRDGVLLSPHPAVVLVAHLLHPLAGFAPSEAVATLVQPASLRDDPGLEELFEQTREIVAMVQRRQRNPVFGAQLAFNLLPADAAGSPIEAVQELLALVLGSPYPVTLHHVQGPVFHCFSAALYLRAGPELTPAALRKAMRAHPIVEVASAPAHLGPIDAAASDKVLLGAPRRDARGIWLWAVMDNLTRGGALNALAVAGEAL